MKGMTSVKSHTTGSMRALATLVVVTLSSVAIVAACGGDDDAATASTTDSGASSSSSGSSRGPDNTGQACTTAAGCYPGIDAGALSGEAQCLTRVPGGYCTHLCTTDRDCCATPGECKTSLEQVCAPFESTGQMMCFLSCEEADMQKSDGGVPDGGADGYCAINAASAFHCRSTGGGAKNRKVCAL